MVCNTDFTLHVWLYLIFVTLFGTMIAFWFYVESLQSLRPQDASLLGGLEPLYAILTTVLWLLNRMGFSNGLTPAVL
ncbi:EamA family transporter [Lentibacillus songyuanensis]|uniref:EamA family transporter n=1 Tax=Lentibacillus songyuanensis TaxID=3136161 RepID=UPI00386211CB